MKGICSNEYEQASWLENRLVCGIDEAGRGPLAGPVVIAGVVFPINYINEAIYDSKALSEKKREALFDVIVKDALSYQIVIKTAQEIDASNIYAITQSAMDEIASKYEGYSILTDCMPLPNRNLVTSLVKGDQKSISIAAASILAKVTRDKIMKEFDTFYPQYQFAKNKGYGTQAHLQAIKEYGTCPIHRLSFGPCKPLEQLSLFK